MINGQSEFFRGLSEKFEYERPDPTRPGPCRRFWEAYISETVDPITIRSSQGDRSVQATLITVGFGSSGGHPGRYSACRVKGVKIGRALSRRV